MVFGALCCKRENEETVLYVSISWNSEDIHFCFKETKEERGLAVCKVKLHLYLLGGGQMEWERVVSHAAFKKKKASEVKLVRWLWLC